MRSLPLLVLAACAAPQAGSPIDSAALANRMQDLTPELRPCLAATRAPAGTIALSWVIEADGRANMVRVDNSTVGDASVEGCMAGVVRRSRFPTPRGEPYGDATFTIDLAALGPPATPTAAGGLLGPTDVNATLGAHQNTLASCLALAQVGGREVTGEIELHWRVAANGRVAWARIASATMHDIEVERCLVSVMMTLAFPPPAGGGPADLSMPLKLL